MLVADIERVRVVAGFLANASETGAIYNCTRGREAFDALCELIGQTTQRQKDDFYKVFIK